MQSAWVLGAFPSETRPSSELEGLPGRCPGLMIVLSSAWASASVLRVLGKDSRPCVDVLETALTHQPRGLLQLVTSGHFLGGDIGHRRQRGPKLMCVQWTVQQEGRVECVGAGLVLRIFSGTGFVPTGRVPWQGNRKAGLLGSGNPDFEQFHLF